MSIAQITLGLIQELKINNMNKNERNNRLIIDLKNEILALKQEIKEHKQNINALCDELDDRCNAINF